MQSAIRTLLDRVQGKAEKGQKRSSSWSKVRREFMENAACESCMRGSKRHMLEAHHIVPFHVAPDLELDPDNLICLCRRCHLLIHCTIPLCP